MSKIDILLGTCNGAEFLSEQINSILNQTYTDWKLIIHDDGSSDNTVDIVCKYIKQYPDKIIFINDNNSFGNALQNFSFLLNHSSANYIMFCDQDDVWIPNKIELTFAKMKELEKQYTDAPLLIHTDLKVVDKKLNILNNSYWFYQGLNPKYNSLNRLLVQNIITGCTMMINRKLAVMALPVPDKAIMHDWWLGLVASLFDQIYYINASTVLYRQHSRNDIGATKFSFGEILNKASKILRINLSKYIEQAEILLERYNALLTKEQKIILEDFVSIKNRSWYDSKRILLKHKILKQGILRNLGLFLCR